MRQRCPPPPTSHRPPPTTSRESSKTGGAAAAGAATVESPKAAMSCTRSGSRTQGEAGPPRSGLTAVGYCTRWTAQGAAPKRLPSLPQQQQQHQLPLKRPAARYGSGCASAGASPVPGDPPAHVGQACRPVAEARPAQGPTHVQPGGTLPVQQTSGQRQQPLSRSRRYAGGYGPWLVEGCSRQSLHPRTRHRRTYPPPHLPYSHGAAAQSQTRDLAYRHSHHCHHRCGCPPGAADPSGCQPPALQRHRARQSRPASPPPSPALRNTPLGLVCTPSAACAPLCHNHAHAGPPFPCGTTPLPPPGSSVPWRQHRYSHCLVGAGLAWARARAPVDGRGH
mmetsp:Transcript_44222/g.112887  ORF Transcript_44222/g.112887 Transcript_44222/m.112887 type:complete len:336 (+) Transcript_44222:1313-2320(+)